MRIHLLYSSNDLHNNHQEYLTEQVKIKVLSASSIICQAKNGNKIISKSWQRNMEVEMSKFCSHFVLPTSHIQTP